MATIEWVNHASFILDDGGARIISDPWLEGPAFDFGWDLLSKTVLPYDAFKGITHLWLSHEHPDHFSPPNLKAIPEAARAGITLLYQSTIDRRVVEFCSRLGFKAIVELQLGQWVRLGPTVEILCEPWDNGDSWLAIRTSGGLVLNLNDCVVTTRQDCRKLLRKTGPVDVLATQFSYANWVGNPDDDQAMSAAAREKLEWLKIQVDTFAPRFVIPFASYVCFSHEDNFYLNRGMTRVGSAAQLIRDSTGALPIVLYPGDVWDVGDVESGRTLSESAVERYERDFERALHDGPRHVSRSVPLDVLEKHGRAFFDRLAARNGGLLTRLVPPPLVFLRDHGVAVRLAPTGPFQRAATVDQCDLVCTSDSLDYAFLNDWGGRTLDINGRFQVPPGGRYWKFKALATLACFNSRGEGLRELMATATSRLKSRLIPR